MNTDTQFELHPKKFEIFSLEEIQFHASLLLREVQNMLIEHGETKDGAILEQDVRQILSKIRKLIKQTRNMDI